MAKNKIIENGAQPITVPVPSSILSGDPIMPGGKLPAVANENYNAATGNASMDVEGAFLLSVTAATALSPLAGSAVKAGDNIYADTDGTLDATTNVYYGFTLTKNTGGRLFGTALPGPTVSTASLITSGSTATIAVRLKGSPN